MTGNLSEQQQAVITDITSGHNVFVTGPGGTGKSYLLNHLRQWMRGKGKMEVCGSTGIAAVNVGGSTLHSWAGIGLGKGSATQLAMSIRNNQPACLRVRSVELLALDEVSPIDAALIDKLDEAFRIVREDERPFGGMQLILLGDFCQLRPIEGQYAFKAKAWKAADIKVHVLSKVFRHADPIFAEALMQMRTGTMTAESKALFNARYKAKVGTPEAPPVYLTTHNHKAERINSDHLARLPDEVTVLRGRDTGTESGRKLLQKCKVPEVLELKIGARVICCSNYAPEDGVMNGSAGTVCGFEWVSQSIVPIVLFDCGAKLIMTKVRKEITQDGKVVACREQFPLRLGWAITVHSSQGLTLDTVEAHLGDAFERGQIYVALSRVRTLEGLSIMSLNKELLKPCPVAMEFYENHRPAMTFEEWIS